MKNKPLLIALGILALSVIMAYIFYVRSDELALNTRVIDSGEHHYPDGFVVEKGKTVVIKPGAILIMGKSSRIKVDGKIIAKGTSTNPITFKSGGDYYWEGILIKGENQSPKLDSYKSQFKDKNLDMDNFLSRFSEGSIFNHCVFSDLMTDGVEGKANRLRSVIESYNSPVIVANTTFSNVIHIGCVQVERSYMIAFNNIIDSEKVMKVFYPIESVNIIYKNQITPKRREAHTWPDGVYAKAGLGIVAENHFDGMADDSIDYDESLVFIFNNNIYNTYDDGMDIDNKTEAYIRDNYIYRVRGFNGGNGIKISNQSSAVVLDTRIEDTLSAITMRTGGKLLASNLDVKESRVGLTILDIVPIMLSASDYEKARKRFLALTQSDIDKYGYYTVNNGEEAAKLLSSSYDKHGDFYVFNQLTIQQDMKNLFKLVDLYEYQNFEALPDSVDKKDIERLKNFQSEVEIIKSNITVDQLLMKRGFYSIALDFIGPQGNPVKLSDKNSFAELAGEKRDTQAALKKANELIDYADSVCKKVEDLINDL